MKGRNKKLKCEDNYFSMIPNDVLYDDIFPFLNLKSKAQLKNVNKKHYGMFFSPLRKSAIDYLLQYASLCQYDKVERMLINDPVLLLQEGTFTDYADRTFKNIKVFQYALWTRNCLMLKVIFNCFPLEKRGEAAKQLQEFEANETAYGCAYQLTKLIEALQTYIAYFKYVDWQYEIAMKIWREKVGGEQRKLPMHIVDFYCGYDERIFKYNGNRVEWFSSFHEEGLGYQFAIFRGDQDLCIARGQCLVACSAVKKDLDKLQDLNDTLNREYEEFKCDLSEHSLSITLI